MAELMSRYQKPDIALGNSGVREELPCGEEVHGDTHLRGPEFEALPVPFEGRGQG